MQLRSNTMHWGFWGNYRPFDILCNWTSMMKHAFVWLKWVINNVAVVRSEALPVATRPGARFINGFSIAIQIRWKFRVTLTSILIQWSLQNFYMARQLYCRGMYTNVLRSDGQQRSYGKAKFPSNLNCGKKTLVKRAPGFYSVSAFRNMSVWHHR